MFQTDFAVPGLVICKSCYIFPAFFRELCFISRLGYVLL